MAGRFSAGGFVEPLHDQGHQDQGAGQGQQEGGGHGGLSEGNGHYRGRPAALAPATFTALALAQALTLALVIAGGLRPAWAFDTLGACQSWQNSRGLARIEVANSIGAAHYLTKMNRLQESDPAAPVSLYSEGDIARVCSER
jgi:hypothetical protein